jgi:hypothetical protein
MRQWRWQQTQKVTFLSCLFGSGRNHSPEEPNFFLVSPYGKKQKRSLDLTKFFKRLYYQPESGAGIAATMPEPVQPAGLWPSAKHVVVVQGGYGCG